MTSWRAAVLSFSPWCLQGLEWGQWRPTAALRWMRDQSNNLLGANSFYSSEFRSCWETNEDISGVLLIKLVWRTDLDLSPEWPFYSCPLISSLKLAWAESWVCKVGSGTVVPSHRETQEISKKWQPVMINGYRTLVCHDLGCHFSPNGERRQIFFPWCFLGKTKIPLLWDSKRVERGDGSHDMSWSG